VMKDVSGKGADVKTIITLMVVATLCIITVGVVIASIVYASNSNLEDMRNTVLVGFMAVVSSVSTYFFTRKAVDSIHKKERDGSEDA